MPKKPKELDLTKYTPKQAAFFYWYSILGNGTKAALRVAYPDFPADKDYSKLNEDEIKQYHAAGELAREWVKKHENPIKLYLDQHDMDFNKLVEKLQEGLDSTKATNAAILVTKKGKMVKAEEQGLIEVPDYAERREWWDRFAKLLGVSVKEASGMLGMQTDGKTTQIVFKSNE